MPFDDGKKALICHSEFLAGAHPLTMGGLAGMGDLVLTCTGDLSRNRTVGLRIGRGEKLADITASMKAVAEGVLTSRWVRRLRAVCRDTGTLQMHVKGTSRVFTGRKVQDALVFTVDAPFCVL